MNDGTKLGVRLLTYTRAEKFVGPDSRLTIFKSLSWLCLLMLSSCALISPPDTLHPERLPVVFLSAEAGPLEAGAAQIDLTPQGPIYMGGFGILRRSEGVHDPITARALALRRGELSLVILIVDVIGLHNHDVQEVRRRLADQLGAGAVLVAATHNHDGPDTLGMWGLPPFTSGIDEEYQERLRAGLVSVARDALAQLQPTRVRWAQAQAPAEGISKNRRVPGLIDRTVSVLALDGLDDTPLATIVHFPCHPEVMGGKNRLLSSDFPHRLRQVIEEERGGVALYLNGALGGMVTAAEVAHTFDEATRIGSEIARVALQALTTGSELPGEIEVAYSQHPVWVPIQNRSYILGNLLGIFGDRVFTSEGYTRSEVAALKLGPVILLSAPGEVLPRVGFELEELVGGAEPFLLLGLGGDELGYIIHEEDYELELYRYEKTVSPGPLTTTLLRSTAAEALKAVGAR